MVGREPDLNPPVDWEQELRDLLSIVDDDQPLTEVPRLLLPGTYIPPTPVDNDYYAARLATPLIQVFSVSISTHFDDGKPCEIYGSVRALERSDCLFDLYDRDPEDSETICKEGTLSLTGPDGGLIIPSRSTTLDLCLKDRIRGVEVVKGQLNLDPVTEDSYDRLLKGVVEGAHGSAYVYYVVFKFAHYGTVQVTVTKNDNAAAVYGCVVAGYENGRMYCSADEEVTYLETKLFDMPSQRPLHVVVGKPTPIKLSRNVVVVPVYTFLTIQVNLWDSNGNIAADLLHFPAYLLREKPLFSRSQNACVEVNVRWQHAYRHLYKFRKLQISHRAESSKEGEVQKITEVSDDKYVVPRSIIPTLRGYSYVGYTKVEVFTVFVGGITEKLSALCRTIMVDDGSDIFSIYKRDESCSELLQDDGLACIEVNYRAIRNCEFSIILNLKDPVRKLEVSRGDLGWNAGSIESGMSWVDKRLCSVVRSKDGYAAVHYEVFYNAFEAFVEVNLFATDPDITLSLYGSLIARYSDHDYSTWYQNKYYTSRLFDCPRNKLVELKAGSKIALLKSIVAVSLWSSLRIEAKLWAFGINNVDEAICGTVDFKIDLDNTMSEIIRGGDYWIEVCVKFKVCGDLI